MGVAEDQEINSHPEMVKKSDREITDDRMVEAEELDSQVIDLERMKFSAKDLKDYEALAVQNAGETYPEEKKPKAFKKATPEAEKNFYE